MRTPKGTWMIHCLQREKEILSEIYTKFITDAVDNLPQPF